MTFSKQWWMLLPVPLDSTQGLRALFYSSTERLTTRGSHPLDLNVHPLLVQLYWKQEVMEWTDGWRMLMGTGVPAFTETLQAPGVETSVCRWTTADRCQAVSQPYSRPDGKWDTRTLLLFGSNWRAVAGLFQKLLGSSAECSTSSKTSTSKSPASNMEISNWFLQIWNDFSHGTCL
jgi:hypothetical protein